MRIRVEPTCQHMSVYVITLFSSIRIPRLEISTVPDFIYSKVFSLFPHNLPDLPQRRTPAHVFNLGF